MKRFSLDELMFDKKGISILPNIQACIDLNGSVYKIIDNEKWYCSQKTFCPYKEIRKDGIYCLRRNEK